MKKPYITKNLVCCPDGTVTYWSPSQKEWICHASSIPAKDLAALPNSDRNQAILHLNRGRTDMAYQALWHLGF